MNFSLHKWVHSLLASGFFHLIYLAGFSVPMYCLIIFNTSWYSILLVYPQLT